MLSATRKDVLRIAWPVFIELLLSSLFSMVNMMMIGRIADSQYATAATAAIGLTAQPVNLALSLVQALNVGSTAIISRYYGARKYDRMGQVLKHVMLLSIICFTIPICLIGYVFATPILIFLGAQTDTLQIAVDYFHFMMLSFLFQGFTMTISAALRGVGETKIPMRNNLIANFINMMLNSVLIYGFFGLPALYLTGTGISTIMANAIACVLMTRYLLSGKSSIRFSLKEKFKFDLAILEQLAKISLPSMMEQLVFRVGSITFTMIVSGLGTVVYAAHQIAINLWMISITPGQSLGIAASALTGQSLGAKDIPKAKRYIREITKITLAFSLVVAVFFLCFGDWLASGYTSSNDVRQHLLTVLPILAVIQPVLAYSMTLTGTLRGAGDTIWPMLATLFGVMIVRAGLAHVFVDRLNSGLIGAWWALVGSQLVTCGIVYFRYRTDRWQHLSL